MFFSISPHADVVFFFKCVWCEFKPCSHFWVMQPTTRTEPPDTRKKLGAPKITSFRCIFHSRALSKSAREKLCPKKYQVTGKKRKMLRDSDHEPEGFAADGSGLRRRSGIAECQTPQKHTLCDLLRVCTWVHEQERSW